MGFEIFFSLISTCASKVNILHNILKTLNEHKLNYQYLQTVLIWNALKLFTFAFFHNSSLLSVNCHALFGNESRVFVRCLLEILGMNMVWFMPIPRPLVRKWTQHFWTGLSDNRHTTCLSTDFGLSEFWWVARAVELNGNRTCKGFLNRLEQRMLYLCSEYDQKEQFKCKNYVYQRFID